MMKPVFAQLVILMTMLTAAAVQPAGSMAGPQKPIERKPGYRQPEQQRGGKQHEVRCPIEVAQTEVTTPLPTPWWQTPRTNHLRSVRIQVIAGEKTLVCLYGAPSTEVLVMRKFPAGAHDCRASGNHFVCW